MPAMSSWDDFVTACHIPACAECEDGVCKKCAQVVGELSFLPDRSYKLREDGDKNSCYLPADEHLETFTMCLLVGLLLIIVLAIIMHVVIVTAKKNHAIGLAIEELKSKAHKKMASEDAADSLLMNKPIAMSSIGAAEPTTLEECKKRSGESISHGLMAWLQRQMRDWEMKDNVVAPPRYNPCKVNLSQRYVMGVGLPLFYGFKGLVIFSAMLTFVTLFIVQRIHGFQPILDAVKKAHKEDGVKYLRDVKIGDGNANDALEVYATSMFYSMGFLFVALFALSLYHVKRQVNFTRAFDSGNSCMADFAIHFRRLPPSITNESTIVDIVETQFNCKGEVKGVSIGYDLSDNEVRGKVFDLYENRIVRSDVAFHMDAGCEELAKAGWGYSPHLAKIEQLDTKADRDTFRQLWNEGKLLGSGHAFVVFKSKASKTGVERKFRGMWVQSKIKLTEKELELAKAHSSEKFFSCYRDQTSEAYRINGTKEVPFSSLLKDVRIGTKATLSQGTRIYGEKEKWKVDKELIVEQVAEILDDNLEPTSTLWFNFGSPMWMRDQKFKNYLINISVTWGIITLVIYFPVFYYLITPSGYTMTPLSPMTSQLIGIILALAGNIMGMVNWNSVGSVGFYSKPDQDCSFVLFSTFTGFFNSTLFIAAGLAFYIHVGFNKVNVSGIVKEGMHNHVSDFLAEEHLFQAYYNMMIPGWMFAGVLTGKLMGWFMPVIQNFALTNLVFTIDCLPQWLKQTLCAIIPWNPKTDWLSARQAEHIFEPPELALAWEYNLYIVTPCCCFVSLFVLAPALWRVFFALAFWATFMLVMHRFPTLLISRKNTTGYRVDYLSEKLWAVVPALVLAAFGFWGIRCDRLGHHETRSSYWMVLFLFILGVVLHRLALQLLISDDVTTQELKARAYADVEKKLRYNWFNTNPVHVLKSSFCPEEFGDSDAAKSSLSVVPFEFGKEYLQIYVKKAHIIDMDVEEADDGKLAPRTQKPSGGGMFGMGCYGGDAKSEGDAPDSPGKAS